MTYVLHAWQLDYTEHELCVLFSSQLQIVTPYSQKQRQCHITTRDLRWKFLFPHWQTGPITPVSKSSLRPDPKYTRWSNRDARLQHQRKPQNNVTFNLCCVYAFGQLLVIPIWFESKPDIQDISLTMITMFMYLVYIELSLMYYIGCVWMFVCVWNFVSTLPFKKI